MKDLVPITHVEATLNVQQKEEERYAAAHQIIAEIPTEIVNLILVRIPLLVVKTLNARQTVTEQSVVVQEDGLGMLRPEEDALIILVMKPLVVQMLIAKIDKEKLYVHADQTTKGTHLLAVS